jgi:hypothetical protein
MPAPQPDPLERRCGTCARFVRVVEKVDDNGEVTRAGECLLGVWPSPLYETNTCSHWVRRGEFKASATPSIARGRPGNLARHRPTREQATGARPIAARDRERFAPSTWPEDLLDMDAEEFRQVLGEVLRAELGISQVELSGRWEGGEMILKPGKPGLQEKRISLDSLFHKIVLIRDKLRVLEQKLNSHPKLGDDEKVQLQQYVTACYGSLTTFNVLFADREDQFVGQKADE